MHCLNGVIFRCYKFYHFDVFPCFFLSLFYVLFVIWSFFLLYANYVTSLNVQILLHDILSCSEICFGVRYMSLWFEMYTIWETGKRRRHSFTFILYITFGLEFCILCFFGNCKSVPYNNFDFQKLKCSSLSGKTFWLVQWNTSIEEYVNVDSEVLSCQFWKKIDSKLKSERVTGLGG